MVKDNYVSSDTAEMLEKKGFNEVCRAFYKKWNGKTELYDCNSSQAFDYCYNGMLRRKYCTDDEKNIAAPTQQMALDWILETFKLHIGVVPCEVGAGVEDFTYCIWKVKGSGTYKHFELIEQGRADNDNLNVQPNDVIDVGIKAALKYGE